jgi:hypothetical protein
MNTPNQPPTWFELFTPGSLVDPDPTIEQRPGRHVNGAQLG